MINNGDPPDIEILATGGFFEMVRSAHGELNYTKSGLSRATELLADVLGPPTIVNTLFLKNSSSLEQQDLNKIYESILRSPLQRIIVLQGTTTIDTTARILARQDLQKTIVLTGTTKPYDQSVGQACFNLGSAICAVQALPKGVYGVMNGRIIPPFSMRKDPQTGRFDTASGEHIVVSEDRD